MKLFRTYPPSEGSVWPARQRSIAYVQVGDLVEMWFHRKQERFAACEFCQTVHHQRDGRCHTCGGAMPMRDEAEPEPGLSTFGIKARPAARSLGNVMRLATLPPLLLFVGFAAWYQMREPAAERPAVAATAPSAVHSQVQAARAHPTLAPSDLGLSAGEVLLPSRKTASAVAKQADPEAEAVPATATAATAVQTDNVPAPRARRAAAQASARQDTNPLAACSGSNFFARAICINSRCADPKAAQLGQCREAIRQRQIDEARRNPSLMG